MSERRSYPALYSPFIWASFLSAVAGGFFLAAILGLHTAYGLWSGKLLIELVQLHGHLQLLGWMGLLLIGVSMYVLPRFASTPLPPGNQQRWIFILLATGLGLRVLAVMAALFSPGHVDFYRYGMCAGMYLETLGIACYVGSALRVLSSANADAHDRNRLAPYFIAMFSGWSVLAVGTAWLAFIQLQSFSLVLHPVWNDLVIEAFIRLTLVPAVFGFGVKMIPVFMGLRAPLWPVRNVGIGLVASTCLYLTGKLLHSIMPDQQVSSFIVGFGLLGISLAVLCFVWFLDALLFRVLPERVALKTYRSDAALQRGRYGDRGEFGRFELFIIAGFAWIALVAFVEGINGMLLVLGYSELFSATTIRHALLLGGLAHIVLGVSHRLLPNLLGWGQLAPILTTVAFFLFFLSSLLRVAPLLLADIGVKVPIDFYALSGTFALAGITLSFANICFRNFISAPKKN